MNKFQLTAVAGGLVNALLMLLFPPYDRITVGRIEPAFDAYYFVLQSPPGQSVNAGLLVVQLLAVSVGLVLALMFLRGSGGDPLRPPRNPRQVLLSLAVAAFTIIMLFPPFETMPASRMGAASFHGFDIAFGGGLERGIFAPMLFLELLLLAANVSVCWLIFGILDGRNAAAGVVLGALSGDKAVQNVLPRPRSAENAYGRSGVERRGGRDPGYQGPDRRRGGDRRLK